MLRRTLRSGPLTMLFESGRLRLSYAGEELTSFVHAYASMLIANLWNDSSALQWDPVRRTGERIEATGHSRRFPFRQHWTLELTEGGVAWRIELEVDEPLDVQEYHASVALRGDYARWQTDHEAGVFPSTEPGREDWRHLNRDYAPGRFIRAVDSGLPAVSLCADAEEPRFSMTPVNAGHSQGCRVLQALRTAEAGLLHFTPGRHLYFAGRILAGPKD